MIFIKVKQQTKLLEKNKDKYEFKIGYLSQVEKAKNIVETIFSKIEENIKKRITLGNQNIFNFY